MIYLKFFSLLFLFISFPLRANEVQIIELYQNKSLDQLVLETENNNKLSQDQSNNNQILEVESTIDEITQTKEVTDVPNVKNEDLNKDTEGENIQDEDELINNNSDSVTILKQEILFDINENIINNHLSSIKEIKSKTLQREFINILERKFKLTGLVSDPLMQGGGMHQSGTGGYLKIHSDFNVHPQLNLNRRLNLLLYLNKEWKEEWGGHLELWDKDMKSCKVKISPNFNKLVIFNTTDYKFKILNIVISRNDYRKHLNFFSKFFS